jgi:hypothetical protein
MNDFSALDVLAFLFLVATYVAGQRAIEHGRRVSIIAFIIVMTLAILSCIQLLTN